MPFLKKLPLRVSGGYISSPCRLRSTQRPPGRSMGVVDSGNAPGLNSRPSACGRSARGRREAAFGGTAGGVPCAARGTAANPARPVAPAVPRAPWASPRPSPSLVGLSRLFRTFFFGPQGGYLRPRAKTVISDAQGGTGGVWGWKGAVQGPPMDPSDGPIAGLVERDTFFWTPLLGYGAIDPPRKGGPEKKYCP